jgi:transcriptional regulator GlxA family with amidase domain
MVLEQMRGNRTPQPHAEASWFGDIRMPLIRRAITVMDRCITRDLSVTEIAEHLRVSNNTLHRAFRRGIGESPAKFFRILRLAHGHWSLQHTDMSISQVAHVYRFSDASHFTRMHRLYYGITPAQTRSGAEPRPAPKRSARAANGILGQILSGGLFIFG